MANIWANFDHFEKLDIFFKYNDAQTAFANYSSSKVTQLTVKVRARAVDKTGKILPITSADLKAIARLCVYESNGTFYQDNSSWTLYQQADMHDYRSVLTEKVSAPNIYNIFGTAKETGDVECEVYIAPNGTPFDLINIAVQVDVPGHGQSSTAKDRAKGVYPECYLSVTGISNVWDVCKNISSLAISFADSSGAKSTIYANGRNQVPVIISVAAADAQGHYLNLFASDFYIEKNKHYPTPRIELVNAHNNDDVLSFDGTKGVCYSFSASEWGNPISYTYAKRIMSSVDNGICNIPAYISSYTASPGKEVAVRLNIPGFACITTAITSTGQWESYTTSKVSLTFLEKIDYSDASNLQIVDKGWTTLDSSVHYTYHPNSWKGKSKVQDNGTVRNKQVLIKPNVGNSEVKFLSEKTVVDDRAHYAPYNTSDKIGMFGYPDKHSTQTYVQSLLDYTPDHGGHIVAWGVEVPEDMKQFGFAHTSGHDCQKETNYEPNGWHYMLDIKEGCGRITWIASPKKVAGAVTLYAMEAAHSVDNSVHHTTSWPQKTQPARVTVYDNFGNSGTFRISWDQRTYSPSLSS
ncbi:hypothetical protein AB1E22_05510 [Buttiauxella gaviniae]|uniref:Uncharacterized protein n=1 Tax=Buttiauxella gaviniae TaxID=82990 RepID=A0ABV3NRK3_9ENTR